MVLLAMIRSISAFMCCASAWHSARSTSMFSTFGNGLPMHEQVLVVVVVRRLGVVEAAGDDDLLVDHHQLVVELAQVL